MKNENCPISRIPNELLPEDFPPEKLFYWLSLPRNPVLASEDPSVAKFITGMLKSERVSFVYVGGETPGKARTITPSLVFQYEPAGRIYIAGYCHERAANRVFCVDRVLSEHVYN